MLGCVCMPLEWGYSSRARTLKWAWLLPLSPPLSLLSPSPLPFPSPPPLNSGSPVLCQGSLQNGSRVWPQLHDVTSPLLPSPPSWQWHQARTAAMWRACRLWVHYTALSGPQWGTAGWELHWNSLFLQIVSSEMISSFQVKRSDGHYIDVPYMPDAVLVNLGALMQQWTSDLYLATVRVHSHTHSRSFPCLLHAVQQSKWHTQSCLEDRTLARILIWNMESASLIHV